MPPRVGPPLEPKAQLPQGLLVLIPGKKRQWRGAPGTTRAKHHHNHSRRKNSMRSQFKRDGLIVHAVSED